MFFAKCLEAKGHLDLGMIVMNGCLLLRFRFCCGYDLADWKDFLELFAGLLQAIGIIVKFSLGGWKAEALERY